MSTHSVIVNDGLGAVVVATLTIESGVLVDSSAKWGDLDMVRRYFGADRFRWAVAHADDGKALNELFGRYLTADGPPTKALFSRLAAAPGNIVLRGRT